MNAPLAAAAAFLTVAVAGGVAALTYSRTEQPVAAQPADPKPTPPAPDPAPADDKAEGEPLPAPPKLDPKNEHTALNKEKTLLLEVAPDPADPKKKKPVRVLFASEVCLRRGPLEVFVCKVNRKEHEAILRTDIDARFIHAALVASGAKPGHPFQFVDPKTEEEAYKPATGATIDVGVHYSMGGKLHTHPAQEWITDDKTKKPMAHHWVFAGSRFVKNPDKPDDPEYYCANNGEVVCLSNFTDSMLDIPVKIGQDNDSLFFTCATEKIPPLRSKVWVTLRAVPEKEKK